MPPTSAAPEPAPGAAGTETLRELPAASLEAAGASGLGRKWAGAFLSPGMVLIALFLVFPAVWTLYLGLTDYRLTGRAAVHPAFEGLGNYRAALGDPSFGSSLAITLLYVFGSAIVGQVALGFALAWKFKDWHSPLRSVVESLAIVAWIVPSSVVAFLWISYLQGSIGPLVEQGTLDAILHISTNWFLQFPLISLIIFNVWRGTAFSMMLFRGALQTVPPSFLETAKLTGASGFQQLRDVVLPRIKGHVLTDMLLISLWTFNDFTPFLLTGGGPNGRTQTLPVFVYNVAFLRLFVGRAAFYLFVVLCAAFFALPMAWLVLAPFEAHPTFTAGLVNPTLRNFSLVFHSADALSSLRNSIILAVATMVVVVICASLAAYALSRVKVIGRDILLYVLLLFSSVVTGSAAMVPIFLLVYDLHLINSLVGVVLVLAGGTLPASIFILKDFMDSTPSSYEESARVFGASPFQILKDIVAPLVRPGIAVIAVWTIVTVWGSFLTPYILLSSPSLQPAAVEIYSFYDYGGSAVLPLLAAFSLVYTLPVVVIYLVVQHKYGFRFHGGIKS
ncbi:MAG: ABC transporter permease subunit [Acidimicrobiales bacterium]